MSHLKNHLLAGAALLALPAVASAQPAEGFFDGFRLAPQQTVSGLYIGAGAGANFTNNTQLRSDSSLAAGLAANGIGGRGRAVFETGWTGVASLGWGFGNGLRVEVEGNFRQNDFDKVNRVNGANLNGRAGGFQRTYGAMANALYDFRIPGVPWFVPYVGGGVGYAWRDWDRSAGPGGASRTEPAASSRPAATALPAASASTCCAARRPRAPDPSACSSRGPRHGRRAPPPRARSAARSSSPSARSPSHRR